MKRTQLVRKLEHGWYIHVCPEALIISGQPIKILYFRSNLHYHIATSWNHTAYCVTQKMASIACSTVEPLTDDHPHQRPSLSYDHISCDGQGILCVYESLTSDHTNVILRVVVYEGFYCSTGCRHISLVAYCHGK